MTQYIRFTDSTLPGKNSFVIPDYRTDGTVSPVDNVLFGAAVNGIRPSFYSITANTSLLIPGRGVGEYGEIISKNIVFLLENFASNGISPVTPTIGQLWYDYSTSTLKLCSSVEPLNWEGLVKTTGSIMSGFLTLSGSPTSNLHAATKLYVDMEVATSLPLTGGTITGPLVLSSLTFTDDNEVVHKHYIETYVSSQIGIHSDDSVLHLSLIEHDWLNSAIGFLTTNILGYLSTVSGNVQDQIDEKISSTGGTMTGPLILTDVVDDTSPSDCATPKSYVVDKIQSYGDSNYLKLTGGILSGFLTLSDDPITDLHAVTKRYVDGLITGVGGGDPIVSGYINSGTNTLTLVTNSGQQILVSGISPSIHTHTSDDVTYNTGSSTTPNNTLVGLLGVNTDVTVQQAINALDDHKLSTVNPVLIGEAHMAVDSYLLLDRLIPIYDDEVPSKKYVDNKTKITRSLIVSVGQTEFTTPEYVVGSHNLWIFVNGSKQYLDDTYTETNSTTITFGSEIPNGSKVEFLIFGV